MTPESHAAELAMLRTQRDALARVVSYLCSTAHKPCDGNCGLRFVAAMLGTGLSEEGPATREQAERFDVALGHPVVALSPFGRAALAGVRP